MPVNDSTPLWRSTRLLLAYAPAAATLILLPHWRPLIFASGPDLYYLPTPAGHDYAAALIWTFILGGAVLLLATIIATSSSRWAPGLMVGLSGLVALNGFDMLRRTFFGSFAAALPWAAGTAAIGSLVALAIWRLRGPNGIATTSTLAIAIFAPFALTTVTQGFVHSVLGSLGPEQQQPATAIPGSPSRPPVRVAWLIFDELDARILTREDATYDYSHFESLRDRSLDLMRVVPPGGHTIRAMPSYWLGRRLVSSRAWGPSELKIRLEEDGKEFLLSEFKTLFAELAEVGVSSGVVGFYHPYCRLFSAQLSQCVTYHMDTPLFYETETLLDSLLAAPLGLYPGLRRRVMVNIIERSRTPALRMLADPALDFVAVHLNVPHRPGLYDPESGQLRILGPGLSIEGNLLLADLTLGMVEDRMRAAGVWDHTVLIVGSDHGSRALPGWDSEPGAVPLIVHMPGQREGLPIDNTVDALITRSLIMALMRGDVSTPAEAASFLRTTSIDAESD